MKQVLNRILAFLKNFFLQIRIHLSVGICSVEDDSERESNENTPDIENQEKGDSK